MTLSDADKLQRLIELARANGYLLIPEKYGVSDEDVYLDFYINEEWDPPLKVRHDDCTSYDFATIIFSHEFIKALCKSKYPKYPNSDQLVAGYGELFFDCGGYAEYHHDDYGLSKDVLCSGYGMSKIEIEFVWQYHLASLAISTDRINYLYETFVGDEG